MVSYGPTNQIDCHRTDCRPEDRLLLCCARTRLDQQRTEHVRSLLREEIDWSYLYDVAVRNGLVPLLHKNLESISPSEIPERVFEQLRWDTLVNARRVLVLTDELLGLLDRFKAHGITGVPYKGPVLAESIYGDVTLREFTDLDIMVWNQDIPRARDLMLSLGYQPEYQLAGAQEADFLRSGHGLSFHKEDARLFVELKWEITEKYFSLPLNLKGLWERTQEISIAEKEVLSFSREDLLLILCVHAISHLWARLMWVCDVAELIQYDGGLNWDAILKQSEDLGAQRIILLGLFLCKDLLEVSLPREIERRIKKDQMVIALGREVEQHLFSGTNGSYGLWETALFHLKARERLRDRVQYCARAAMTITPGDWAVRPLPNSVFPIYYLIRPIRLMAKYGLKSLRG